MRILYGVCGEGAGHATRSKVVIEYLASRGHEVLVAASRQALELFDKAWRFKRDADVSPFAVLPIVGVGLRCVDGAIDLRASIEENARRLPAMLEQNADAWTAAQEFAPTAVISDYDFFACAFAHAHRLPVVSIDNAQIMSRCLHPPDIIHKNPLGFSALAIFTDWKHHACDAYVITSFYHPPVRPEHAATTTLVPPILRREVLAVLASPPPTGNHLLVYKTEIMNDTMVSASLAALPEQPFVVYGMSEAAALPRNAVRRSFSEAGFLRDLASARGVVSNGGMSLLGEALSLQKPVLAIPVGGHHEQILNACYLDRLGYGTWRDRLDAAALGAFVRDLPRHQRAIAASYPPHDRNVGLYATLERLFPSGAPGAYA